MEIQDQDPTFSWVFLGYFLGKFDDVSQIPNFLHFPSLFLIDMIPTHVA